MNLDVELVHARLERHLDLLGPGARERLHMARELRRLGRHRLASSIETQMLQALGIDTLRGGPGSLAHELAPDQGWFGRLRDRLTPGAETTPEIQ